MLADRELKTVSSRNPGLLPSIPPHSQRISYAIDIVKPGRYQSDLQDAAIVKAGGPQALVVISSNPGGIARQPGNVIKHHAIRVADRSSLIILFQSANQAFIQSDSTQKLRVRFDSIMTAIQN